MEERGVQADHATLNRRVIDYSPFIAAEAKKRKQNVATPWRADEIYVKSKTNGSTCIVLSTNSVIPSILCYTPRGHNCGSLKAFNALYYKELMCFSFPHP
jgi:hypothetical protein